jgi:hypothetical protein
MGRIMFTYHGSNSSTLLTTILRSTDRLLPLFLLVPSFPHAISYSFSSPKAIFGTRQKEVIGIVSVHSEWDGIGPAFIGLA